MTNSDTADVAKELKELLGSQPGAPVIGNAKICGRSDLGRLAGQNAVFSDSAGKLSASGVSTTAPLF